MSGLARRENIMGEHTPLVSIIMSVYNEERYLGQSLDSLLGQTLSDFEIIIVDDCSGDGTVEKIESYHDARIRLIRNEKNQGLTKNLNKALGYCRGKYIARMDGDDISLPGRLEKQVRYLETHPEIMLTGCQTRTFGEQKMVWRLKASPQQLRIMMLIRPVLAHPSFMMRGELIREYGFRYDESFRSAQDYDFAQRVSERFDIGIVPEVLLRYRTHKKQVSSRSSTEQYGNADRVRRRQMEALGITELDEATQKAYQSWVQEEHTGEIGRFLKASELIGKICRANREKELYPERELERTLKKMLYTWLFRAKSRALLRHIPRLCAGWKDYGILFRTAWEIGWNKLRR